MHESLSNFLKERIAVNDFPSAVYLVAEKGEIVFQDALGYAVVEPERSEAGLDTIYDVASLTKPLVTGLLCAGLIERGRIKNDWIISNYLPEFNLPEVASTLNWDTLIYELASHSSLFPAWKPFYLLVKDREGILKEIIRTSPRVGDEQVVYSDLNFLVLTFMIERVISRRLDECARQAIFDPLQLTHTFFNPKKEFRPHVAANEKGNEYEKQTCIEQGYLQPPAAWCGTKAFRDYQIWGEVHDGNAWFMGGVAGHAGLFSTAEEVFRIALQFLPNYTQLLKPETCELFRTNFTKGMNEDRSFAFQLASTEGSTAGAKMSRESFGHNGFTGTSLWIDPVKERVFVLLTNRTHDHPLPFVNINSVRRHFHDLAIDALDRR